MSAVRKPLPRPHKIEVLNPQIPYMRCIKSGNVMGEQLQFRLLKRTLSMEPASRTNNPMPWFEFVIVKLLNT